MFKIRRSNSAFNKLNSSDSYIKAEQKLTKNIPSVDHQLDLIWTILHGLNKAKLLDYRMKFLMWTSSTRYKLHVTPEIHHFFISLGEFDLHFQAVLKYFLCVYIDRGRITMSNYRVNWSSTAAGSPPASHSPPASSSRGLPPGHRTWTPSLSRGPSSIRYVG